MNKIKFTVVILAAILFCSCAYTRNTTTPRTAVEQALLTESADRAVDRTFIPDLNENTFEIKDEGFNVVEKQFLISSLKEKLLENNGRLNMGEGVSDLIIEPRANLSNIDDSKFLLGLPSIPIPVPGVGTVESPEIALFGKDTQKGRSMISLWGVKSESGKLHFVSESPAVTRKYTRWTVLIFFTFRTSNLEDGYAVEDNE